MVAFLELPRPSSRAECAREIIRSLPGVFRLAPKPLQAFSRRALLVGEGGLNFCVSFLKTVNYR
jgi:hypothetical protein